MRRRDTPNSGRGPLHVVIVGAHPDDPETCAGGLAALAFRAGHDVTFVYLTDGQAGIDGSDFSEAGAIRRAEATISSRLIGARCVFLGEVDGETTVDRDSGQLMQTTLLDLRPDVVVTHWPIDTHRDHRVCSTLVLEAWLSLDERFSLYYMEALTGYQTRNFSPETYVPIDDVVSVKHEACFQHVSQRIFAGSYNEAGGHGEMERKRGQACDSGAAEAFVRQEGGRSVDLIELATTAGREDELVTT